jgi:hypothetical protein
MYPTIYLYLYGLIRRRNKIEGSVIHISDINTIIKSSLRMSRKVQKDVPDELVKMKLLKRIDRDHFEIISIPSKFKLLDCRGDPLW